MTRPVVEIVTCPNCGAEGSFTLYTSINSTYHPKLLKKMKRGDLSIWRCPKCKKKYHIQYEYLHHDMEKGMIEWSSFINQHSRNQTGKDNKIKFYWWCILAIIILLIISTVYVLVFA